MYVEVQMGTQWIKHKDGIAWEESGQLHRAGLCHGVTGRTGGVSPAPYHSLNLALHVGDSVSCVLENRRRLCAHLGCRLDVLTTPQQTHEDHVIAVGDSEIGRGAGSYHDAFSHTDALMTSRPGVLLLICIADCVPVILYDPVKKACAVIHDGWRGTASRLASKTVFAMQTVYGSQPRDILAFIGPSISREHFEVSEATSDIFRHMGPAYDQCVYKTADTVCVDLWQANQQLLLHAGLLPQHIDTTTHCAYQDEQAFYSYRRDGGHTGRMAAFAMIPAI